MSISREHLEYLKVAHPTPKLEQDPKQILLEKLKIYRGILTSEKLEYLESLIQLENSALQTTLSNEDQLALLEFGFYRDVVKYNISHRIINLVESLKIPEMKVDFDSNSNVSATLYFEKEQERYKLYFYDSRPDAEAKFLTPEELETDDMRLGHIYLYQFLIDDSIRAKEVSLLRKMIAEKKTFFRQYEEGKIKIRTYEELTDTSSKLERLKNKLQKIQKPITKQTKYASDVITAVYDNILKDYGLTSESFEDIQHQGMCKVYAKLYNGDETTHLHKTLVKRMPGLLLTTQIKYR